MRIRHSLFLGGLAVFAPSLFAAEPSTSVSFGRDIVPVFVAACTSCHVTGEEAGRLALAPSMAYMSLVNVPSTESKWVRVKPYSPEESYLLMKLNGTHLDSGGKGARMPYGAAMLEEPTRDLIRAWIASGAKAD